MPFQQTAEETQFNDIEAQIADIERRKVRLREATRQGTLAYGAAWLTAGQGGGFGGITQNVLAQGLGALRFQSALQSQQLGLQSRRLSLTRDILQSNVKASQAARMRSINAARRTGRSRTILTR